MKKKTFIISFALTNTFHPNLFSDMTVWCPLSTSWFIYFYWFVCCLCLSKGRETTLKKPVYFFNVEFKNDAGQEADVLSSDSKQNVTVPPGKSVTLKFTKNLFLPSTFRAVEKASGNPLKLKDSSKLKIEASQNPDEITRVSISKPSKKQLWHWVVCYFMWPTS